jgi:hypothetical protein
MLTLSQGMISWAGIGMVTIRSDTRRSTSSTGTISRSPGSRTPTTPAEPEQHPSLVLLDDPDRQPQPQHHQRPGDHRGDDEGFMGSPSCPGGGRDGSAASRSIHLVENLL